MRRAVAALLLAAAVRAEDSSLRWRTVRTPHFAIHYYEPLGEVAQGMARRAERAHDILAPLLAHDPGETHIVLVDDTDSANGLATPLPYNHIVAFVTAPEASSDLGDFDDWLFDLVLHEYAHIVHLDTIHGLPRLFNAIFGKTLSWNMVQPRWFVEGLGVHEETARTASGRGRSSLMHMYMRAQALEGSFQTLDQITGVPRAFPRGTIAYVYGGHFLGWVADRYGEGALREISHDYAGARADTGFLPFGMNRVARRAIGKDWVALYAEFEEHVRRRAALEAAEVRARGETPSRRLTFSGESVAHPRWMPDGRILYFQSDGVSHAALRAIAPGGGEAKAQAQDVTRVWDSTRPAPAADGRRIVIDQGHAWRTFYAYRDLMLYDVESERMTRLTDGARARDPDLSPDGRTVAFSMNGRRPGSSSLARVALDPTGAATPEVLVEGRDGWQVYTPSWSPDGRTIAYSGLEPGGWRDLFLYDVATGATRRLWRDRALDVDPRFSRDGRWLFFASDRTGIYDVYAYDLREGALWQVTNVINGAFQPEPSPDGRRLAFVGFSAAGFDLHVMDLDPARWLPAPPHVDERRPPPAIRSTAVYPDHPYRPSDTFYPRSWEFGFFGLPANVEAATNFSDAIGRHAAAAAVGWNTEVDRTSFALRYAYQRLWPALSVAGGRVQGPRSGFVVDGERLAYTEIRRTASGAATLPLVRVPEHSGSLTLQYRYDDYANTDVALYEADPGAIAPRFPATGALAGAVIEMAYDGTRRWAWSVSPEESRHISVVVRANRESLGSDYRTTSVQYQWEEFLANPLIDRHVLALAWRGGISKGDPRQRGAFGLGGFGEQDFVRNLLNLTFFNSTPLRGYPPAVYVGEQYALLNAEYRFPILATERGIYTYPLYLRYLHGAVIADWGGAFDGPIAVEKLHPSVGAELRQEFWLGYALRLALRVGYARGLDPEGIDEIVVILGSGF